MSFVVCRETVEGKSRSVPFKTRNFVPEFRSKLEKNIAIRRKIRFGGANKLFRDLLLVGIFPAAV